MRQTLAYCLKDRLKLRVMALTNRVPAILEGQIPGFSLGLSYGVALSNSVYAPWPFGHVTLDGIAHCRHKPPPATAEYARWHRTLEHRE